MIPGIPAIGRCAAGIGHRLKIPAEVIGEGVGAERGLLIIGVIADGGGQRSVNRLDFQDSPRPHILAPYFLEITKERTEGRGRKHQIQNHQRHLTNSDAYSPWKLDIRP